MIRLLTRDSDGKLILREFDDHDIPAYAILSHTWNPDNSQEVTFDDDLNPDASEDKDGYRKISFCEEKAVTAGLQYFWIDTCCINKRSETELSEAINSMFRWYKMATRCYVYLSDVSLSSDEISSPYSWQSAFRKSRWFMRGWTLQELIAPKMVEFFTKDGQRLGDKASLELIVQDVTGIDIMALRGHPLSEFSVEERKSWAEHRITKRPEDEIYSLLGIFGVTMPLIYGEGKGRACRRLDEEISKLSKENPIESQLTSEEKWGKIIKSRGKDGRCFNCGSEAHWEYNCRVNCGLYPGHKVSKCRFPIRCIRCQGQGHIAEDCPEYSNMPSFSRSLGKAFSDTRNPRTISGSINHNQEGDVLTPSHALEQTNIEVTLEHLARAQGVHLDWRSSVVDLLKLLGLASDLNARRRLAEKLHVRFGPTESVAQNAALRTELMKELTLNNGEVPSKIYVCYLCGELGHREVNCPNKCYTCQTSGHWTANCPNKSYNCKISIRSVINEALTVPGDKFRHWAALTLSPIEKVVEAVAANTENGREMMALLLDHRGDEIKITEKVVRAAAENSKSGKEVMELLLELRGDEVNITEEVIQVVAGNTENGKEVLMLLLDRKGNDIQITEEVVRAAACNENYGKEIVRVLLEHRGDEVQITEGMIKAATGNSKNAEEVIALLLERKGNAVRIISKSGDSDVVTAPTSAIFSLPTMLSTAITGNSLGTYAEVRRATDELVSIFLHDQDLRTLCNVALESKRIGSERLARNLRRLLKAFSVELKEEARDSVELELASIVLLKAGLVATRIVKLVSPQVAVPVEASASIQEKENISNRPEPEHIPNKEGADVMSDEVSGEADNERNVALIVDCRTFLEESNAFKKLRKDFREFIIPPPKGNLAEPNILNETRFEASPDHEPESALPLVQKIYTKVLALFSSIGLGEQGIPPGHQRISWLNRQGKMLYDDYIEHEPGALKALQEFLNTCVYRNMMTPGGDQRHVSSPFGHSYTSNGSPAWAQMCDSSDIANQMREATAENGSNNCDRKDAELGELSTRTLRLLSCMEKGRHSTELHQEIVSQITDDRQLFRALRSSYYKHRGNLRPYWSLRTVHSIQFMKFAYGGCRYVDVRSHDVLCEHGKPCDCIPPADLVPPKGVEYECYPIPSKLSPPVGQRLMMDFFNDPDGIEPDVAFVLQQLPKRTCGELQSQSHELIEAWGIYYKEGWDWTKIWLVLAIGFFPPSLLFGVLWGILKQDVQGAFGIACWWMTGATIIVGIVGTCTWTL